MSAVQVRESPTCSQSKQEPKRELSESGELMNSVHIYFNLMKEYTI